MITKSDVLKVDVNNFPDAREFALITSQHKSRRKNTANTWQKGRSEFRKFTDLFPGDLAKNVVRELLTVQNIQLTDYDHIRTDHFLRSDPYDLKCGQRLIEVKSSLEKSDNRASTLLNNRRFMVYAGRDVADVIIQVFYVFTTVEGKEFFMDLDQLEDEAFKNRYQIQSNPDFVSRLINFSPSLLIMGFITRSNIGQRKKEIFSFRNDQLFGDRRRDYLNIFIKEGNPFSQLPLYLNSGSGSQV